MVSNRDHAENKRDFCWCDPIGFHFRESRYFTHTELFSMHQTFQTKSEEESREAMHFNNLSRENN